MSRTVLSDTEEIPEYGHSFDINSAQQCQVQEYASNNSLAGFCTDKGNGDLLTAYIPLSIMLQLTRTVYFLHAGGRNVSGMDWNVFHCGIKEPTSDENDDGGDDARMTEALSLAFTILMT